MITSSKGHSPIKYTAMVPVHIPSQSLPGPATASAKPTPPPVPPKPITFTVGASVVGKASPGFVAKMSAVVASTTPRKTASVL